MNIRGKKYSMDSISIIRTLDIRDDIITKLCNYISKEKEVKISRFLNKDDKIQSLMGEIAIRVELIKNYNMKNKDINIKSNEYGKFYIDQISNFFFNISHSGEYVVVAISSREIGVDIEKIQEIDYLDIANNFFSKEEINYIIGEDNKEQSIERFYEIWTLKEAYIKFYGKGLSIPLESFTILPDGKNRIMVFNDNKILNEISFLQGYKLAICRDFNYSFHTRLVNQNELIECFLKLIEKEKR